MKPRQTKNDQSAESETQSTYSGNSKSHQAVKHMINGQVSFTRLTYYF